MVTRHSLHVPGDTWLHHLHPLTKLSFSLAAAVIIFGGPGGWLAPLFPGLLALLILGRAGLGRQVGLACVRLLTPLAVMLFFVHGFFNPQNQTVLLRLGPFAIGQEGLVFAALIIVRLAATLVASLLLVLSTHPADLIQALTDAGLPHGLAYLLGSPLLLLPQIADRVPVIQAAQQARGLETGEGRLLARVRALFPLVAPLVFSALVDVEERSLALEVRGFNAPCPKTSLRELADTPGQRAARWILMLLTGSLLAVGIVLRIYGRH